MSQIVDWSKSICYSKIWIDTKAWDHWLVWSGIGQPKRCQKENIRNWSKAGKWLKRRKNGISPDWYPELATRNTHRTSPSSSPPQEEWESCFVRLSSHVVSHACKLPVNPVDSLSLPASRTSTSTSQMLIPVLITGSMPDFVFWKQQVQSIVQNY